MKNFVKIISLALVFVMVFTLASCKKERTEDEITTAPPAGETEETAGETGEESGTTGEDGVAGGETTEPVSEEAPADGPPSGKAEILALYTEVMNKAKEDKPAYKKYEYQEVPGDELNRVIKRGKGAVSAALAVANTLMTSESKAKASPEVSAKGSDMRWFPVYNNARGCLVTDTGAIKSASCEKLANGNYKITITLYEEQDPEPAGSASVAPSNTGGMFYPLSKADIDATIESLPGVTVDYYGFFMHDCTAVLEFDPATKHIVYLDQTMTARVEMGGRIIGINLEFMQELYNTMRCYDFEY